MVLESVDREAEAAAVLVLVGLEVEAAMLGPVGLEAAVVEPVVQAAAVLVVVRPAAAAVVVAPVVAVLETIWPAAIRDPRLRPLLSPLQST